MSRSLKDLMIIFLFTIVSTALIWLPHYLALPNFLGLDFSNGFNTIYRNFDGVEYIIIAKSWYQSIDIYYASHFPGYPLFIWLIAPIFGYLKAMIFVSVIFTVFAAWAFYFLVRDFHLSDHPLLLTIIFLILPARWLVVRSVGTSETIFIFFVITSIYFFMKGLENRQFILVSAIAGAMAQLSRPPGDLLTLAYFAFIVWQGYSQKSIKYILSFWPLILMPLTLLGIFCWFGVAYNDFWGYFHSGDNIHLTLPPFAVFNKDQHWVGSIWLEDIVYILLLGYLSIGILIKRKLYPMAFFSLIYLVASSFIAHRDISRYTYPIVPFAIIAFEKVLVSKEFRWVLIILSLAIYLYSQNFILANTAPIPNPQVYN